jgi:hypothetical protein
MGGIATNGLTAYTAAEMTGAETMALDTNLSSGREPQSAAVTLDVLQDYLFGGVAAGTATATAGAATLAAGRGKVTSEALTTAAAAAYTLTITNTAIAAADIVMASVANGTNTQGVPVITRVTPAAGSLVIVVTNLHASQALNGTLVISFIAVKP